MLGDKTLKRVRAALKSEDYDDLVDLFGVTTRREGLFAGASFVRAAAGKSAEERERGRSWLAERGLLVPKG